MHRTPRAPRLVAAAVALVAMTAASAADVGRYVIEFKPGAAATARAALANAGGRVKLEITGMDAVAAELPVRAIAALKRNGAIRSIEVDAKREMLAVSTPTGRPYRPGQLLPYGIPMVQADKLPRGDLNAANRKVCIIDSGYDNTHEDLAANDVTGEFDSGTGWWYTDESAHGTHVAGTIAALNQRNVGVVGVNPSGKLKLHIVKVFGAGGAFTYSSTLADAAGKCEAAGSNIITMSLGGLFPSSAERAAFDRLAANGILSIAAAGNFGNSLKSYPAAYTSVMSVAAVDENKAWASFSQFNSDVEIAGPGVAVLSTVPMGTGEAAGLTVGATPYAPNAIAGSPQGTATAPLAPMAFGETTDPAMAGKVCLIQRGSSVAGGSVTFETKVQNCQASGGVGAVIYNNVAGPLLGSLTAGSTTIPAVGVSDTEGATLLTQLGQSATVSIAPSNYAVFDGTSMATPHVSAVAAQVWSYFPTCTAQQIRDTLNKSALDLGPVGRDTKFGFGLVQARAAYDRIASLGCAN
jgi:subtilisin family serine protease